MSSKREREQERRRQEKFEQRVAAKEQHRRAATRRNVVVAAVVAVVAAGAVVGASLLGGGDTAGDPVAAEPTAPSSADALPSPAEATVAAPVDETNPCPPGPGPVAQPVVVDEQPPPAEGRVAVTLATTCGDIEVVMDGDAAPEAVGSFVGLAEAGYYDSTPCHRLTTAGIFVLQCGDPTATGQGGPGYSYGPVENAPADDVYPAGTVAMARVGGDGESMGSQFFVVYEDSTIPSDAAGGYSVLGQVTSGLDIVEQVAEGGLAADGTAPARSIGITSVTVEESA
ncbi:peptidylprolyl isomerase [Aquipuribacter nitratireducens]|uniref:peptidylprolyl isomerase n=1 Tax=Aquipuribacter nitratireducens TaxID=650104 RepID=A0ABW0GRW2_9MICO